MRRGRGHMGLCTRLRDQGAGRKRIWLLGASVMVFLIGTAVALGSVPGQTGSARVDADQALDEPDAVLGIPDSSSAPTLTEAQQAAAIRIVQECPYLRSCLDGVEWRVRAIGPSTLDNGKEEILLGVALEIEWDGNASVSADWPIIAPLNLAGDASVEAASIGTYAGAPVLLRHVEATNLSRLMLDVDTQAGTVTCVGIPAPDRDAVAEYTYPSELGWPVSCGEPSNPAGILLE